MQAIVRVHGGFCEKQNGMVVDRIGRSSAVKQGPREVRAAVGGIEDPGQMCLTILRGPLHRWQDVAPPTLRGSPALRFGETWLHLAPGARRGGPGGPGGPRHANPRTVGQNSWNHPRSADSSAAARRSFSRRCVSIARSRVMG